MVARFAFASTPNAALPDESVQEAMGWIAGHCRTVAEAHMALAEKAEGLMERFLDNRRFRSGLRSFARHHQRAAWQHLDMCRKAEAARLRGCDEFDMTDVVST